MAKAKLLSEYGIEEISFSKAVFSSEKSGIRVIYEYAEGRECERIFEGVTEISIGDNKRPFEVFYMGEKSVRAKHSAGTEVSFRIANNLNSMFLVENA